MHSRTLRDDWADFGDESLLDVRLADLPLALEGSVLARGHGTGLAPIATLAVAI